MSSTTISPDRSAIADLRAAVTGDVITSDDAGYEEACKLWNGAIDRRPAVFVRAASAGDVATAIATARENDLPLSVRGGGHHVTGVALVNDGLVVDLSGMDKVTIDPETRTAQVGPGARVADVLNPAQEHGLSPVVGSAAQNGVAGSTLAGGIGWLRRKVGLGVDNLRSVELVTVEGDILTASESENSDLFWAIRGGGANVGVVTSFEMELVEAGPEMAITQVIYPIEAASEVLRSYRAYAEDAPDEVTTLIALMRIPPLPMVPPEAIGTPVVMVYGVYAGPIAEGEQAMTPLGELGEPMMDMSGPQPLAAVHEVARELFPDARRYSWHSLYATELADETIDAMVEALVNSPSEESELSIWHLGGAIADVDGGATAFGFRDVAFMLSVGAAWEDPEQDEECTNWAREVWEGLRDDSATVEGFYPGFPGVVEGEERAQMAYGDNYDRLTEIKAKCDPENVFHHNLNIKPAS
ncbi:FAD-binding oxidoreductase [Halococcus sediminicola]|uniref:FAD-binding oxidoreductase n=1 Tax=Halococcus sediminicola TaxID=1264579 RepID=UPI000678655D|nr:FAD-binding oxidoreductase [Halococcus sediminicola]